MSTTNATPTPLDIRRMSHRDDPHTSHEAAERASTGTKKSLLYGAIVAVLATHGPGTPSEVLDRYTLQRLDIESLPEADLQEIRRRMTELEHDFGSIEPIRVGTQRGGKPQFATREGQRVMRLTEAAAA
ncbi:hypothetical protein [Agromyces ramosus]|uniref:Uncharacterized protein n=1 Tax=Agromyces ramosus TaxID=33879 RepID=A0ABU0R8R4_9MICO|nr:hypothetical protein [Agromyces ramosus]MDQ0894467.1 hypothetical protein [Agromyces ramosus]